MKFIRIHRDEWGRYKVCRRHILWPFWYLVGCHWNKEDALKMVSLMMKSGKEYF